MEENKIGNRKREENEMKFKKPLSLLLAAVLLCAFAVPLLETPALAADKEIHEVATAGVYKWITITAGEGGAVTEVEQTGGVLLPGMSLGKNEDVSSLFGTPTTPGHIDRRDTLRR